MVRFKIMRLLLSSLIALAVLIIVGHSLFAQEPKDQKPVPNTLLLRMKVQNIDRYAPIYMRAFKKEGVIEAWKQTRNGDYALIKSFPVCKWSGELGPKVQEGDYQTPEGFYTITPEQMHPKSNYHLAFNIGFPNAYDRANRRTGSYLMVHGKCKSVGCFAMTDEGIEEIYALAREAFLGGQRSFPFHSFPFRMNGKNLASELWSDHAKFWLSLKPAYDLFEITRQPPRAEVCGKSYVVTSADSNVKSSRICRSKSDNLASYLSPQYVSFTNRDFLYYLSTLPFKKGEPLLSKQDSTPIPASTPIPTQKPVI